MLNWVTYPGTELWPASYSALCCILYFFFSFCITQSNMHWDAQGCWNTTGSCPAKHPPPPPPSATTNEGFTGTEEILIQIWLLFPLVSYLIKMVMTISYVMFFLRESFKKKKKKRREQMFLLPLHIRTSSKKEYFYQIQVYQLGSDLWVLVSITQ